MSQFMSNKYLRYRGLLPVEAMVIERDRPCRNCDYNLRGLRTSGRCPECGTPIASAGAGFEHSLLSDAPLSEIRRLRRGLWLGVACAPALAALIWMSLHVAVPAGTRPVVTAVFIGSLLWVVAAWLMTPALESREGIRRGFTAGSRLRLAARLLQFAWPGLILVLATFPPSLIVGAAAAVLFVAGLSGIIALALMLMGLADWCCDRVAERLLNFTVWMLPATSVLMALMLVPMMGLLFAVALMFWLGSLGSFALALLSLASSASWSTQHARRRMQRDREQRERMAKTVAEAPRPPAGPIPLAQKHQSPGGP